MKKQDFFPALIGGAIGAVVMIVILAIFNEKAPMNTKDLLSFVLSAVAIVIAAMTVLGAVVLVSTWNDIDERSGKIFVKYEEQAKQSINTYQSQKEAEIAQNAKERQEAINSAANSVKDLYQNNLRMFNLTRWTMIGFMLLCCVFFVRTARYIEKKLENLPK